jgi:RHS repeat-associated protein
MANQTVGSIAVQNTNGPAGQFDVMVADMTITQANGNIIPIVGAGVGSSSGCTTSNPSNSGPPSCANEQVTGSDFTGQIQTTHYYFGDLLGSAQIELSDGGWPLTLSAFDPYGQEIDTQTSTNHYKFTGKERDTESGLDYFGARYYASSMGRFMSPDWSDENDPVPYADFSNPQSLNLYSYAYNNPLRSADADGHVTCDPDTWDDSTNTLTAGACHYDFGDFMNSVGQIAQKATSALSNAAQTVSNFVSTNQTLCRIAATAGGAAGGALAGGEAGGAAGALIGGTGGTFVAPGVGTIGGGAGGAAIGATIGSVGGGIAGGIAGYAASNALCSSGGGGGGGGGNDIPGRPYTGKNAAREAFKHLEKYHGISPEVASERLHEIKAAAGLGAADDVAIGRTGDVYNAANGEWIGSLTAPR